MTPGGQPRSPARRRALPGTGTSGARRTGSATPGTTTRATARGAARRSGGGGTAERPSGLIGVHGRMVEGPAFPDHGTRGAPRARGVGLGPGDERRDGAVQRVAAY